ncbi:hypothetical protein BH10ACI3_BH10ACI3_04830 [soil metagenome]
MNIICTFFLNLCIFASDTDVSRKKWNIKTGNVNFCGPIASGFKHVVKHWITSKAAGSRHIFPAANCVSFRTDRLLHRRRVSQWHTVR